MNLRVLLLRMLIAAVGFAVVCALALVTFLYSTYPFDDRTFASEDWAASNSQERGRMVSSLLDDHLPKGMTEQQVTTLLGEDFTVVKQGTREWPNPFREPKCHLYYVGSWGNWGMDSAFAVIFFDDNGQVTTSRLDGY
ncbi:MAG: hypothetical protein KDA66_13915 [Planctomycetaceae bacterium]|nr:hypothetical protein [Planctomycetaceae bacterium]